MASAPVLRSIGPGQSGFTIPDPAGRTSGDLLIVPILTKFWDNVVNTPSGWNLGTSAPIFNTNQARSAYYWRIADGTATDVPTFTGATSLGRLGSYCIEAGTFEAANPIPAETGTLGASTTSHTISGLTTPVDNCFIIYCAFSHRDNVASSTGFASWTAPSGETITERVDWFDDGAGGGGVGSASFVRASAGVMGTGSVSTAGSGATNSYQYTIAIQPPLPSFADTRVRVTQPMVSGARW